MSRARSRPVRSSLLVSLNKKTLRFVQSNAQKDGSADNFVLETSEMLEVNLQGRTWARVGSMIAYTGRVNFERESAFEGGIEWDIEMMKTGGSMVAGGLFNVKLAGSGMVAITSHGKPLTLEVQPGQPIYTDPQATVAWSGSLTPQIESNMSFKSLIGRGSGESVQYKFDGDLLWSGFQIGCRGLGLFGNDESRDDLAVDIDDAERIEQQLRSAIDHYL